LFGRTAWRWDTAALLDASIIVKSPEDVSWQEELLGELV
jgi:hypothetical protein